MKHILAIIIAFVLLANTAFAQEDVFKQVEHHYAENEGVKIHYVSMGEGPVLIMLHGFPDFWYTWRYQMAELSKDYKVVAVDLRGYNKSDKPKGVANYAMPILMKDVVAVIDDLKLEKATIIANDWGGAIAWQVATFYPSRVEKFIALNIPHPAGMTSYLNDNPQTGQYAQDFKKDDAAKGMTAEGLANSHSNLNSIDRERYVEAFRNSSFEGMLNYYKANYPSALRILKNREQIKPKSADSQKSKMSRLADSRNERHRLCQSECLIIRGSGLIMRLRFLRFPMLDILFSKRLRQK